MKNGPTLTITASCFDCEHKRSERYACQGDSGTEVSCAHPQGKGYIGDTTWNTPSWCPMLPEARSALLASVASGDVS